MEEIVEVALVTNRGIKFREVFYSCSKVIREGWFERAWNEGNWEINIICDLTDLSEIRLADELLNERVVCNIIERQSESGEKLIKYFESIEKLKKIRNNHRDRGEFKEKT
ncbi:MAG: hypothetical protein WDZ91_03535 [Paenibacillaceae bacterium]